MDNILEQDHAAPAFTARRDGGATVTLADYAGQYLVLYFYPRDNTPGCTTEAIDFTRINEEFSALNAAVVGVSKDSVKKHENFCAKHDLGIPLLSDEDGKLCGDYGVWVEKTMYGKKSMGIERSTFLIGPDGKILHIWRKVKVKEHAQAVLDALKEHLA